MQVKNVILSKSQDTKAQKSPRRYGAGDKN